MNPNANSGALKPLVDAKRSSLTRIPAARYWLQMSAALDTASTLSVGMPSAERTPRSERSSENLRVESRSTGSVSPGSPNGTMTYNGAAAARRNVAADGGDAVSASSSETARIQGKPSIET